MTFVQVGENPGAPAHTAVIFITAISTVINVIALEGNQNTFAIGTSELMGKAGSLNCAFQTTTKH